MAEPFAVAPLEAIAFLRNKLDVPTATWTDVWQASHDKAFTVAGAQAEQLVEDFHQAVLKAIENGETLEQFREKFDAIVKKHGWSYHGTRNWRSRVIFQTNLRTAMAAGRTAQIERLKAARPYLRYVAVLDDRTRPAHRAWHDTVLPVDHPWWETHFPPNGWSCRCTVQSLSERDLKRYGLTVSDQAPDVKLVERSVKGRGTILVPEGIDPGFAYHPGKSVVPPASTGAAPGGGPTPEQRAAAREAARRAVNEIARPFGDTIPAERERHRAHFGRAPADVRRAIATTEALKQVVDEGAKAGSSYYHPRDRRIVMREPPVEALYGGVWRHEYGHHLDYSRAPPGFPTLGLSLADRIEADGAALVGRSRPRAPVSARPGHHQLLADAVAQAPAADRDGIARAGLDLALKGTGIRADDLITLSRPDFRADSSDLDDLLDMADAFRTGALDHALRALARYADAEQAQAILFLSDAISAATGTAIGQGHTKAYYAQFDGWLGPRSGLINLGHATEVVANYTALAGGGDPISAAAARLLRALLPRTARSLDDAFAELGRDAYA